MTALALPGGRDRISLIADLALYGVALPAEPVLAVDAVPGGVLPGRTAAVPDVGAVRLRFVAGQQAGLADHSVGLRNFVADTGTLLTHPALLAVLAMAPAPAAGVLLPLAPMELPTQFLAHLAPATRTAVIRRMAMLTETRRRALGLSGSLPAPALHQHILTRGMGPAIAAVLAPRLGLVPERIALVTPERASDIAPDTAQAPAEGRDVPLPSFNADDPLSVNLVALAIRRGFFGPRPQDLRRLFVVSPQAFGRPLARQRTLRPGDAAAALAACQFSFLSLH